MSTANPEISLAMPCYNERAGIAEVIARSIRSLEKLKRSWELVVIDNHSSDGTPEVVQRTLAREPRGRLIVHDSNRFYSGSCQTALRECRGRYVAIMDSDGQFAAADLPQFLEALEAGANLVFGWRRKRYDPLSRKVMSTVFRVISQYYLKHSLHDLNVGLRMFDRKFIEAADLKYRLNFANPELYVCARRAGLIVTETPISHANRLAGSSCHDVQKLWNLFWLVHSYLRDLGAQLKTALAQPTNKNQRLAA